MARRTRRSPLAKAFSRGVAALTRQVVGASSRATRQALKPAVAQLTRPRGEGDWIAGIAAGVAGARRFRLYRPPNVGMHERLPLLVMLHGCGQNANSFASSTRMNAIAARESFLVLYPEQDRLANAQGCWNWFETRSGRAQGEAELIMKAIDQVCLLYQVDRTRIALAGLSAGASMAALLATRYPERFGAVVMHSGIPPGMADSGLSAVRAMRGQRTAAALAGPDMSATAPWPPLLVIHGDGDRVVALENGRAAVATWADISGATAHHTRKVQRGKRYPMRVTDFKRGRHLVATLAEVAGLGHAWSGGLKGQPFSDEQGPDASRITWTFIDKQFRVRFGDTASGAG